MLHTSQPVTALRARASADMPELGLQTGDTFYMVRDGAPTGLSARFRIVKWTGTRWFCSCGEGRCEHKRMISDFLFQESEKRRTTGDDLSAQIEDDIRTDR